MELAERGLQEISRAMHQGNIFCGLSRIDNPIFQAFRGPTVRDTGRGIVSEATEPVKVIWFKYIHI